MNLPVHAAPFFYLTKTEVPVVMRKNHPASVQFVEIDRDLGVKSLRARRENLPVPNDPPGLFLKVTDYDHVGSKIEGVASYHHRQFAFWLSEFGNPGAVQFKYAMVHLKMVNGLSLADVIITPDDIRPIPTTADGRSFEVSARVYKNVRLLAKGLGYDLSNLESEVTVIGVDPATGEIHATTAELGNWQLVRFFEPAPGRWFREFKRACARVLRI